MSEQSPQNHNQNLSAPVIEQLHPYEVVDNAGFNRQVFTFGNQELVFKGREELPQIPGFEGAIVAGAEEAPRFSDPSENLVSGSDTSRIIANQTPLGVAEAGIALGIAPEVLTPIRDGILRHEYSPAALEMIDAVTACRIIGSDGKVTESANKDAEALVLLALSGDQAAQQEVTKRREVLGQRDVDRQAQNLNITQGYGTTVESLNLDNLLLVRKTNETPQIGSDGAVLLRSTADLSDGSYIRHSIHFSLDATVVGHEFGNWDGKKYTIVDGFGSVLAARKRPPTSLASNDTWFEQNPGEPLVLPTARIFVAEESHHGAPIENGLFTTYNPLETSIETLVKTEREKRHIDDPGDVEKGGWKQGSTKLPKLSALSKELGVPQGTHVDTDEIMLESRMGAEVSQADSESDPDVRASKLFSKALKVDWERLSNEYSFQDQDGIPADRASVEVRANDLPAWASWGEGSQGGFRSLNRLLASCSIEARRNFYASGLSIPRATVIRGVRKEVVSVG